jgi:exopolysaccharide biosynthesis protein
MIQLFKVIFLCCIACRTLASTAVSFSGRQWLTAAPSFDDRKAFSEIEDFSVDILFKTQQQSSGDASLLEKWNGGLKASRSGFPFAIRVLPGGRLLCATYGGKDFKVSVTSWGRVNDDVWHTVLCTKSKGVLSLYVDGQLHGQASNFNLPPKSTHSSSPITIGRRGDDHTPCFFIGVIGFVRVSSFGGSSAQVLVEHHKILEFKRDGSHLDTVCKREGILACWAMDDGHGSNFADDGPFGIHAECHGGANDGSGFTVSTCPEWLDFTLTSSTTSFVPLLSDVEAVPIDNQTIPEYEHLILAGYIFYCVYCILLIQLAERLQGSRLNGHLFRMHSSDVSFLPPAGGCPGLKTVEDSAREFKCDVATNAGFFNPSTGDCYGNLVSDGRIIQLFGTENVNFGIRKDGSVVVGYMAPSDIVRIGQLGGGWKQLIQGMGWLVRNGKPYLKFFREDFSHQMTGDPDFFVRVKAPRLALGVNLEGHIMLLQFDGDENVRGYGADLMQMAKYFIKYGNILHAVNLDGGSSDSVMIHGVTVNAPMEPCHNHAAPAPFCQRPVATVLCFRKPMNSSSAQHIELSDFPVMPPATAGDAGEIQDIYYMLPRIGLLCVLSVAVMAFVVSKTRSNQLNDVRNTLNTASSLILLFFQVQLQDFSRSESNLVLADVQESSQLMFN